MINTMSSLNGVPNGAGSQSKNINKRLDDMEEAIAEINETLASSELTKGSITINNHLGVDTVDANTINTNSIEAEDISGGNISSDSVIATPKIGGADGVNTLEVVSDQVNDKNLTVMGNLNVEGEISLSKPNLDSANIENLSSETITASTKVQSPLVTANEAIIENAVIESATINNLENYSSENASIDNLISDEMRANTASIVEINSEDIETDTLDAKSASIEKLDSDKISVNVLNMPNHEISSGTIEMEDLQAEGNYHTVKVPVVDGLVHIHVEDKEAKDQYNESQKWFSVSIWTSQIGGSRLVESSKHQYSNVMVAYATDDISDSLVDIKYDVENKYIYFRTNRNGIIHWTIDSDTTELDSVSYSENEYAGIGNNIYEYIPQYNQRTVLFGDNTVSYGMDVMGQLEAAISPTYEALDIITLRYINQLIYDKELAAEADHNGKGKPHDLVAQLRNDPDSIEASGWFRGDGDRQVIRTIEKTWTNDSGIEETFYRNDYEDTVVDATIEDGSTGTIGDKDLLISQKAIADWNGKVTPTTGNDYNPITKLGEVDEGEWNAGSVTTPALTVNGDTVLNGDLVINGSAYEEHTENLFVSADFIELRDGATSGLDTEERSGLLVENYDGNGSKLGVVTTNDGELRIGDIDVRKCYRDVTITPAVYYSDKDLTTIVDVSSFQLYPVGSPNPETNIQEYTYTYADDTEPVLTRDEKENMVDNAVLAWDSENNRTYATGLIYDEENDSVKATNAEFENTDVTNTLDVHNADGDAVATIDNATISNATITEATISNTTITDATITAETVTDSEITNADITNVTVTTIKNAADASTVYDSATKTLSADKVEIGNVDIESDSDGLKVEGYYNAEWATLADKNASANYVAMVDGNGKLRTVSGSVSMWIEE